MILKYLLLIDTQIVIHLSNSTSWKQNAKTVRFVILTAPFETTPKKHKGIYITMLVTQILVRQWCHLQQHEAKAKYMYGNWLNWLREFIRGLPCYAASPKKLFIFFEKTTMGLSGWCNITHWSS